MTGSRGLRPTVLGARDLQLQHWLQECWDTMDEEEHAILVPHVWPEDVPLSEQRIYEALREVLGDSEFSTGRPLPWPGYDIDRWGFGEGAEDPVEPQNTRGKSLGHRIFHAAGGRHN